MRFLLFLKVSIVLKEVVRWEKLKTWVSLLVLNLIKKFITMVMKKNDFSDKNF